MVRLRKRGKGVPLSIHVARYFALAFVLIAAVWVACFAALSASMEAGFVYPANWGAANAREVAARIQENAPFDPASVPTAYRYALFDADGSLVSADMEGPLPDPTGLSAEGVEVTGSSGSTYVSFPLEDGTTCVLASAYMPQFTSPALRDTLPNPQNVMLAVGFAVSLVALGFAAARAGRFVGRKLSPLTDAAARVALQDLEFSVDPGGVREVDEVLMAMDGMRASLKDSLEARWDAERRQRDQVAALAHDLRNPLTVVRANSELILEDSLECPSDSGPAGRRRLQSISQSARAISAAAARLDSYVRLLIDSSRGVAPSLPEEPIALSGLCSSLRVEGSELAKAAGVAFSLDSERGLGGISLEQGGDVLLRALMNVVSNAVEHASTSVAVSVGVSEDSVLTVEVCDDGEGFSPEALRRGCERFFTGEPSRSGRHYGIGLSFASEAVSSYGGAIALSNRLDDCGNISGAKVALSVPLAPANVSSVTGSAASSEASCAES